MTIEELIDVFTDKLAEKLAEKISNNPTFYPKQTIKPIDNVVCMYGVISSPYNSISTTSATTSFKGND